MPLRLYKASGQKTLRESVNFQKEFRSSAATADEFQGPSPSVSITVSAVSIDLTAISINLVVSYDEEGVVHPQG
jgi:hypothetical protein